MQSLKSNRISDHGAILNELNWKKYIDDNNENYSHLVKEIISEITENANNKITRLYVKNSFKKSYQKGVVATVMWGYPKGNFPGGKSFKIIFLEVNKIACVLETQKNFQKQSAEIICNHFKGFKGLGVSTFTKLLYFAEISAVEGYCLIYDQMIMRYISVANEEEWRSLKESIGSCRNKNDKFKYFSRAKQLNTYSRYLSIVNSMANKTNKTNKINNSEMIELEMFEKAPRGRESKHFD